VPKELTFKAFMFSKKIKPRDAGEYDGVFPLPWASEGGAGRPWSHWKKWLFSQHHGINFHANF